MISIAKVKHPELEHFSAPVDLCGGHVSIDEPQVREVSITGTSSIGPGYLDSMSVSGIP